MSALALKCLRVLALTSPVVVMKYPLDQNICLCQQTWHNYDAWASLMWKAMSAYKVRTNSLRQWVDHVGDMVFVGLHVKYLDGVLQSDF